MLKLNRKATMKEIAASSLLAGAIMLSLFGIASAITNYPPGSLLQPSDVTSSHIRDNTIVNADISQTTAFTFASTTSYVANIGALTATTSATLTATTTFGTMAWHMPQTDGTSGQVMTTNGAGGLSLTTISQPYVSTNFTAAEAITSGETVSIGDTASTTAPGAADSSNLAMDLSTTQWAAHSTTTPGSNFAAITSGAIYLRNLNASPQTAIIALNIYADSAGAPTGASLSSGVASCLFPASTNAYCYVTLTAPFEGTPSTKYWFIFSDSSVIGGFRPRLAADTGNAGLYSINSGSTWTTTTNTLSVTYSYAAYVAGKAYKASATTTNYRFNVFVGFATNTVTAGQTVTVANYGWLSLFSGLSIGQTYYMSNTNGAISTSAGSQSLIVGRGITSTMLGTRNP